MPGRLLPALLLAVAALAVAGCGAGGGHSDSRPDQDATLILDAAPNAVHAGIYLALQRGYDQAEGVRLRVAAPSAPTDGIKALAGGQADLAVVDLHDLAIARERHRDIVGVMALVQTPLAAVLARPGIARPRDLEGRRVAVGGRPADRAALDALVRGDGGHPGKVRRTTIRGRPLVGPPVGYAAATAFWTVADVARPVVPGTHAFRIDRFGAPPYPELVLATSRESLATNGPVIRAAVRALRRGYQATIEDPESAVTALTDAVPALRRAVVARELDAVSPSFTAGSRFYGELDPARLATWAAWEQKVGIVGHRPNVARAFDPATAATGLSSDPNN